MALFENIKHLFVESLNTLNKLWSEEYTDSYLPSNLIKAVRKLIDANITVKGSVLGLLVSKVHLALPRFYKHKVELARSAVSDYLLLAATRNYFSGSLFNGEDISDVCKLLIDDISLEWYECRVYGLISGIYMNDQVVQIDGSTRLRRATKFEIRAMLQESSFENIGNLDADLRNITQYPSFHVYVLESQVSPEDPTNPRKVSSGLIDPLMDSLENLIMMLRVICGKGVGTRLMKIGCWVDTSAVFNTRRPFYEVAPCDLMRSITMSGTSLSVFPSTHEVDSHAVDMIRVVWNHYTVLKENAPSFLTHHLRSTIRYTQSLNERYLEDRFIDLAVSVETLAWSGGERAAGLISSLLGVETTEEKIREDLNWLFEERNHVAHGGRLSIDTTPRNQDVGWGEVSNDFKKRLRRVEVIIRCTILASIFVAGAIDEGTEGKRAFRLVLQRLNDNSSRRNIQQSFPQWLFDEIGALYS
jgi:hypothetical protein